ncbi:MAG TPA: response regulator transcription factor [Methylophilaceae bacterium]|nr:response regulator transcription factor [Methylophilaceae bacterium]
MRDLFISPRNNLLENWATAFEHASIYASLAEVKVAKNEPCLFWLHVDANSQQWLSTNVAQILAGYGNSRVIVLANVPEQAEAGFALGAGALGYCHAYSEAAVLQEVKAVVSHGGIWLGQDFLHYLIGVTRQLITAQPNAVADALGLLTPREREVAQQASIGLSNKEIARKLDITERTVKAHLSASFERLGVKDRLQLALVLNDKTLNDKTLERQSLP